MIARRILHTPASTSLGPPIADWVIGDVSIPSFPDRQCAISLDRISHFTFDLRNYHRARSPSLYTRMYKYIGFALSHHSSDMPELHLARSPISGLLAIAILVFRYTVHRHIHFPICDHSSIVRSTLIQLPSFYRNVAIGRFTHKDSANAINLDC